jgi:RNA polymerase sigma-70 factor (ECF subfamily)
MSNDVQNTVGESGDGHESFVQLLTGHQLMLRAYIRAMMPGHDEAQDVLQETNLVLWRKKGEFQEGTNFRAWACKVARFQVMAWRQKRKRHNWLVFDDDIIGQIGEDLRDMRPEELDRRHRALNECAAKLPAHDRELLRRCYVKATTLRDYARELGRSVGTLKTRLFRIRAVLRRCIVKTLAAEEGA